MEFLVILLPLMLIMFLTGRHFIDPYLTGMKKVDHLKYPTLARAQRIHRYKDVKAREIEATHKNAAFKKQVLEIEAQTTKEIERKRLENQVIHEAEMDEWDIHFKAITAEEDERKRKEEEARIAKVRAEDAAAAEVERQRNLAIWEANEKVRIARFKAEQKAMEDEQAKRLAAATRKREQDIQTLQQFRMQDANNMSYGNRFVCVHGLYVRKLPTKAAREEGNLMQGASIGINGWIRGEEVYGNPIWFKLANDVGWVWSGGVDNKSTSGLINYNYMNEPGDSFTAKNADGSYAQTWTAPSQMQSMIDAELAALKREQEAAVQAEFVRNPFGKISANMITADRIYVGSVNSNPSVELTSSGMKVRNNEGYTALEKKVKRTPERKSDDFWAGTAFADPDYFDELVEAYDEYDNY